MNIIVKFLFICLFLNLVLLEVNCGDITISYSPPTLRFGSADSLYTSEVDDLVASALGYTPESLTWPGLTVTSAFKYPFASIVFGIKTAGALIKLEGSSYELKEDISLTESYNSLTSLIGGRAQRPIHFQKINALNLEKQVVDELVFAEEKGSLSRNKIIDSVFLQQMEALPTLSEYLKDSSSAQDNGQDIIFVDIDSFAPLIKEYGVDSPQVKEATEILRSALEQTVYRLRTLYNDRLIVLTAMMSTEAHTRRVREAPAVPFGDDVETRDEASYNLAAEYSEDFPVIFNIVLILSIILISTILATSLAMAFMDPGRDSIIYRMTNPRMKKEQ